MCMNDRKIILTLFVILFPLLSAYTQETLPSIEAQLKDIHSRISIKNPDQENIRLNDSIAKVLENALHLPGSMDYPFDSVDFLGKITSPDKKIRTITWNLEMKGGTFRYSGFILHKMNGDQVKVYTLSDQSAAIAEPEKSFLKPEQWYGCLIYDIIEEKIEGLTCYFYLGYHPESIFINQKMIDVFWFHDQEIIFGKPVFDNQKSMNHRIIFRYSAKARMMLTWNDNLKMIVFDHLIPTQQSQTGNYQFYVPDLSYDGLKFEKGFWVTKENLDVRN